MAIAGVLAGCSQSVTSKPLAPSSAPAATKAPATAGRGLGWPVWIGIVCDDFDAQRHFYRDVLGLREHVTSADSVWLLQRGVEPVGDVEGGPNELWAYFKDADGNLFELVQHAAR